MQWILVWQLSVYQNIHEDADICSWKVHWLPFGQFSHTGMFKLVDSMVVPILTYGAEIWVHAYYKDIEKVLTEFCWYYLGVNSSVYNCMVLGACGRVIPSVLSIGINCCKCQDTGYPKKLL